MDCNQLIINIIIAYIVGGRRKLVQVSDTSDALNNDRVYRKALDSATVLKYIKENRGEHFDPQLVDIFFANSEEIMAVV